MNSITITGNLTRDAELRSLNDGTAVLSFAVADNQGKDKKAIFWDCSLFGKRADPVDGSGIWLTTSGTVCPLPCSRRDSTWQVASRFP